MARWVPLTSFVALVTFASAAPLSAQSLGTFSWQLAPYCNVVTVTITQHGRGYTLTGVDDQCGAARSAPVDGTAVLNPDGTVGFGVTIVPSPSGAALTVDAAITPATLSGPWRDSAGHSGTLQFAPAGATGGSPRPAGGALGGLGVGYGLYVTGGATPALGVDGTVVRDIARVHDGNSFGVGPRVLVKAASDAYDNTAVGENALAEVTVGDFNSAVGHNALTSTTDGVSNAALGWNALGKNLSGSYNVAIGADTLERSIVGNGNVAVGDAALFQLQLGNNNIGIGQKAGFGTVAGSFNIYIGANGVNLDNYTTRIGSTQQQRTFIGGIRGVQTGVANGVPVVIDSSGQLGTINSSRRFKEDIADLGGVSDAVLQLRPVQFRYRAAYADGSKPLHYGLIAEEVAEVLPELTARGADGAIETVHYETLPTLLLAQIQRLERERVQMAERLAVLERELSALRPR